MEIVKADAFWGLVGAVIGGSVSIVATKMQIKAQNEAQLAQQKEQHDKTMLIIMRFIKKEVKHNYEVFKEFIEKYEPMERVKNLTYAEFSKKYTGILLNDGIDSETTHYDKFKYEIAYMENVFANEIIDFYDLFEMFKGRDLKYFSEGEHKFIKETLNKMEFFILADYDHWGGY